ncbi:MAG TPA: AgmX/PglI C-terminal domain-containing protein [Polyangiaceae bacterium]|nr:AgmX/PglI C-terminal domain-containing protein [Polyangiaceae bacterium]
MAGASSVMIAHRDANSSRRTVGLLPMLLGMLVACGASTPTPTAEHAESAPKKTRLAKKGVELSAGDVVQHLRGNETDLRRCFFANPSLRGLARYSWQLDVEGKVHGVRREASTLGDPQVEACIEERLGEIHFGDLAEPATARWTFVFRLVDPPPEHKGKHHLSASGKQGKRKPPPEDDRGLVIDPGSPGVLAPDAIDNVVEAGYPLFARCYRDGVSRNNDLGGNIRLHFVVSPSGAVSEVSDGGSDLTDRQVVDCIAEGFYALRFPQPDHGSVSVLYRIRFDAG